MSKQLAGKVALVTGGSRGIGAAIAERLALEGANVAISYEKSSERAQAIVEKLKALGVKAAAFQADQGDPAQVAELVKSAHSEFGQLDILVNSAGVFVAGKVDDPAADTEALDRQNQDQCRRRRRGSTGSSSSSPSGRPHYLNRHGWSDTHRLPWTGGLRGRQGCGRRLYPGLGKGPGLARHHGQRDSAWCH